MKRTIFVSCLLVCLLTLSFVSCDSGGTSKDNGIKDGGNYNLNGKWVFTTREYDKSYNLFMTFQGPNWSITKIDKVLLSGTYKYKNNDNVMKDYTAYFTTTFADNTSPFNKISETLDFDFVGMRDTVSFGRTNQPNALPLLTSFDLRNKVK